METGASLLEHGLDEQVRLLDPEGRLAPGYEPDLDEEDLVGIYREMRLLRLFDERMVSLQRQGRIGTYAPAAGQEATQIGPMYALGSSDLLSYQYREHGTVVHRGFPAAYLSYWAGHEAGNAALTEENVVPLNISIGSHIPHATGLAWAVKKRGDDRIVLCHFGDGATSEGDFHEGLNFAGVFDVPAIFFCNNNGWAISIPRERQTASATIARKATAYGFDGVRVDGMDPLACYEVARAARERARADGSSGAPRPTLVEAETYRFGAHTTADDPTAYRDEEAVERWRERDPLDRMEAFLRRRGLLDDERVAEIESEASARLAAAVEELEGTTTDPANLFADAYAEPTPRIEAQQEFLNRLRERHGDDALRRDH